MRSSSSQFGARRREDARGSTRWARRLPRNVAPRYPRAERPRRERGATRRRRDRVREVPSGARRGGDRAVPGAEGLALHRVGGSAGGHARAASLDAFWYRDRPDTRVAEASTAGGQDRPSRRRRRSSWRRKRDEGAAKHPRAPLVVAAIGTAIRLALALRPSGRSSIASSSRTTRTTRWRSRARSAAGSAPRLTACISRAGSSRCLRISSCRYPDAPDVRARNRRARRWAVDVLAIGRIAARIASGAGVWHRRGGDLGVLADGDRDLTERPRDVAQLGVHRGRDRAVAGQEPLDRRAHRALLARARRHGVLRRRARRRHAPPRGPSGPAARARRGLAALTVAPHWIYALVRFHSVIPESGGAVREQAMMFRETGMVLRDQLAWAAGAVVGPPFFDSTRLREFLGERASGIGLDRRRAARRRRGLARRAREGRPRARPRDSCRSASSASTRSIFRRPGSFGGISCPSISLVRGPRSGLRAASCAATLSWFAVGIAQIGMFFVATPEMTVDQRHNGAKGQRRACTRDPRRGARERRHRRVSERRARLVRRQDHGRQGRQPRRRRRRSRRHRLT